MNDYICPISLWSEPIHNGRLLHLHLLGWYTYIKYVKFILKNVYFDQWLDLKPLAHFTAISYWPVFIGGTFTAADLKGEPLSPFTEWWMLPLNCCRKWMTWVSLLLSYFCWFPLILFNHLICLCMKLFCFFLKNSPSPRNKHKRNKAQIYDGMVQIYFSVFEARRNYKVHRLSWDFEVLLCPDWIMFAQSVWATSRKNLCSEIKLKSACSVLEACHLGHNKFR